VCAACLWSRFVVAENFESHLKLENSCNDEGVCEDQIVLSLSLPSGVTSRGQEGSVEFPSVADSVGTVWTFVAPWTVKWTSLTTESIHQLTYESQALSSREERFRVDKADGCPVCDNTKYIEGFCCEYGTLRSEGIADDKTLMSQHCLRHRSRWYFYIMERVRTHYTFEVKINRPFRDTEGFMVDDEITWYFDSDRPEFVLVEPEDNPDRNSYEYSSHKEVSEMSAPGLEGRYFARKFVDGDKWDIQFLNDVMLFPFEFLDKSGLGCVTGINQEGWDAQSLYCNQDPDACNDKMIHELYDIDTALGGEGEQAFYWIQGFCDKRATVFDVDELYYLRCPFYANLQSQISLRMPVDEEQKGSWIATVSDGTCSTNCPDFYDVVCFVNNSCWRPIGIMFLTLTFICVGLCFLCYLVVKKQKALEKRVVNMRKSKEDRDARTSSMTSSMIGGSLLGPPPQMMSQCGAPTLPAMSQYGVLPMETQGSQYGVPMQSQGGALPMGSQFGAPMQSLGGSPPMGSQFGAPMQSQGGSPPMGSQFGAPMQSLGGSPPMGSQFGSQPMSSFRGW